MSASSAPSPAGAPPIAQFRGPISLASSTTTPATEPSPPCSSPPPPPSTGEYSHSTPINPPAFVCTTCHKTFTLKRNLTRHIKLHVGPKFKCGRDGCPKVFARFTDRDIHIKSHTGEKNYVCTYNKNPQNGPISQCGKRFLRQSDLNVHERRHIADKPFHCTQCPKQFIRRCDLAVHLRRCKGPKPTSAAGTSAVMSAAVGYARTSVLPSTAARPQKGKGKGRSRYPAAPQSIAPVVMVDTRAMVAAANAGRLPMGVVPITSVPGAHIPVGPGLSPSGLLSGLPISGFQVPIIDASAGVEMSHPGGGLPSIDVLLGNADNMAASSSGAAIDIEDMRGPAAQGQAMGSCPGDGTRCAHCNSRHECTGKKRRSSF